MRPFQIIFNPTSAAELARMPKELQLQILGEFRGLPQEVMSTDLEHFGKLERTGIYGLVFLFFPGLILFAPFVNLRMQGQGPQA